MATSEIMGKLRTSNLSAASYKVTEALTRFEKFYLYRRTVNELMSLSDKELSDLGFGRSEIRRIAQESVYGF